MRVVQESQGLSISLSYIYPPNCMSKEFFTLAPPTKHIEFSVSSLRSEEWLQCPTIGASDILCKYVPWNFLLTQKPIHANTFSCMSCGCL